MVIYSIALIAATTASSAIFPPPASLPGGLWAAAVQASAYAGRAKNAASGPVPKNASSWVSLADYPVEARAANRTGKAVFRVEVDKKGSVQTCQIVESSGHADLDRITCLHIAERAIFEPARTAKGRAIWGTYQNSVRWQAN